MTVNFACNFAHKCCNICKKSVSWHTSGRKHHYPPVYALCSEVHSAHRLMSFTCTHKQDPGQLSLAIPSWVGAMITSQRAVMPCGWGVKAGMVCVWVAGVRSSVTHCHICEL